MVLRSDRRWIVAFGERNHHVRLPSLACRNELVELGNEWIAVRGAEAWDGSVVQALAVARVFGGCDSALDAEVGDEGSINVAADDGAWDCRNACDKRE